MEGSTKSYVCALFRGLILLGVSLGFISSEPAYAQPPDFTYKTYGLEVDADNTIQNATHLNNFFERLHTLQQTGEGKVSVVHIGDSHVQADYMTSIIRRGFHRAFGNAGRGLIVPLRVARTNEPNNYKTESNVIWKSKRCVFPEQALPIGVGGVTIQTTDPNARLDIFMNDLWLDYRFNVLTLFHEKHKSSFDFSLADQNGKPIVLTEEADADSIQYMSRMQWENGLNAVRIQMKGQAGQKSATIYGAVLENSMPGVLYHTIGVNGAKFRHYREAKFFGEQTAGLRPDLFIVSLGTNESIDYPYMDKNFYEEIDAVLSKLKMFNPAAEFMLVTPQDAFRQRTKANPGVLHAREVIIRYAVENGLAFYDMFRALGGHDSAARWSEAGLLSKDGVHLTRDGYEYQGSLFYHAIMKSYHQYVSGRHQ